MKLNYLFILQSLTPPLVDWFKIQALSWIPGLFIYYVLLERKRLNYFYVTSLQSIKLLTHPVHHVYFIKHLDCKNEVYTTLSYFVRNLTDCQF